MTRCECVVDRAAIERMSTYEFHCYQSVGQGPALSPESYAEHNCPDCGGTGERKQTLLEALETPTDRRRTGTAGTDGRAMSDVHVTLDVSYVGKIHSLSVPSIGGLPRLPDVSVKIDDRWRLDYAISEGHRCYLDRYCGTAEEVTAFARDLVQNLRAVHGEPA